MLEQLFGSQTRVKLLALFLKNQDQSFFVRELTRKLKLQINAIRRELLNLEQSGIIQIDEEANHKLTGGIEKKYYQINKDCILYSELKALFIKNQLSARQDLLNELITIGNVKYLVLTGAFVGEKEPLKTDMLIVGKVTKTKLTSLLKKFEFQLGYEVNYTIMTEDEFKYRKDITDKFLYKIIEGKKIVVIDQLPKKK